MIGGSNKLAHYVYETKTYLFPYPLEVTGGSYQEVKELEEELLIEFPYPLEVNGGLTITSGEYNDYRQLVSVPNRRD